MADVSAPCPVKYFVAILFREPAQAAAAIASTKQRWGDIDFEGADHLFDVTDYYEPEMGAPLYRRLVTFGELMSPAALVDMKLACNDIEEHLASQGKRTVNLDAGYLDHNKTLLASAKEAGQKVYLDKGIYADLAGRYKKGKYQPFEWSFPDFRDGRYDAELLQVRAAYMAQLKQWRRKGARKNLNGEKLKEVLLNFQQS
ncbi:MAG: DUF4416 family protein [Chitinivibrionales bacterium]|nr:DUF4416 family protein [Chitinivibrionales bacterium]